MRWRRHKKRKWNRVLVLLLLLTLTTAGIVVYAVESGQKKEKVGLDESINGIQTGESAENEENSADQESAVLSETAIETETLVGIATETETETGQMTEYEPTRQRAAEFISRMTIEEKVAQMFFITPELLTGTELVTAAGDVTTNAFDRYPVGGLVYFAKNLETPDQTRDMLRDVQEYALQTQEFPVFLGVDEEGGRVLRIASNSVFGVPKTEAMGVLAAQKDTQVIRDAADTIGVYLSDLGFNVNFAPDADVLTNESNQAIGDRSFGSDPHIVADMAWAYTEGLHQHGILACYKHFPGHGGTVEDTHAGYAYSYKTIGELKETELVPFQSGCDRGIDFIMVSHVSIPNVTGGDIPATLSGELVTDLLRQEMGFQGIIITDSMSMGAVSEHYSPGEAVVMAVQAGCDMLLMADHFEPSYNAVLDAVADGEIAEEEIDASVLRIIEAKLRLTD